MVYVKKVVVFILWQYSEVFSDFGSFIVENLEIEFFILFDEELLDEEIEDEFDLEVYVRKICKCDSGSDSELDGNGSNNLEKVFKIVVCKVMRKIK